MNSCAVRKREIIGKLAARGRVSWNVFVKGRESLELKAGRLMGIEDGNRFSDPIANGLDRGGKVGIACDERVGLGGVGYGVHQHFGCEVDIGPLLLQFDNGGEMVWNLAATLARFLVKGHESFGLLIKALNEFEFGKGRKRLPVVMLIQLGLMVNGIGLGFGGKVLDGDDFVLRPDNQLREFDKVEPSVWLVLEQSVKQIEAINVHDCLGHIVFLKMLRPRLLPASRRIGSASAGGCNPSRGSGVILANLFPPCNRGV